MLPMPAMQWFVRLATAMCFAALAGCATKAVPAGSRYIVSAPRTSFYKYGPAQSFGPDFALSEGQKVTMIDRSFGFSRVMTDDGTSGFVASEDLQPAPPDPLPLARTEATPLKNSMFTGKPRNSNVQPTPGDPLFDVNDVPLPMPIDEGSSKPKPNFRF